MSQGAPISTTAGMRAYFEGANMRKKSGRMYLRWRFHAKEQEKTFLKLKHWTEATGYRLFNVLSKQKFQ